jgi:hypothetical protein
MTRQKFAGVLAPLYLKWRSLPLLVSQEMGCPQQQHSCVNSFGAYRGNQSNEIFAGTA